MRVVWREWLNETTITRQMTNDSVDNIVVVLADDEVKDGEELAVRIAEYRWPDGDVLFWGGQLSMHDPPSSSRRCTPGTTR